MIFGNSYLFVVRIKWYFSIFVNILLIVSFLLKKEEQQQEQ